MRLAWTVVVSVACTAPAPNLHAVNGMALPDQSGARVQLQGTVGEAVPLVVDADPGVIVWSVGAPPGWSLDRHTLSGEWVVEPSATTAFTLLVEAPGQGDATVYGIYPVFLDISEQR